MHGEIRLVVVIFFSFSFLFSGGLFVKALESYCVSPGRFLYASKMYSVD